MSSSFSNVSAKKTYEYPPQIQKDKVVFEVKYWNRPNAIAFHHEITLDMDLNT